MVRLTCHVYNDHDIYIYYGYYKAMGTKKFTTNEYHFSISEKSSEDNSWCHICTRSGSDLINLVADVCEELIELQNYAEGLQNEHKSKRNKRPIL